MIPNPSAPESSRLRRLVENRWALVPVAMLAASVALAVVTVRAALSGQGAAVERDYYERAVDWESVQRQRAVNERLRWNITPSFRQSPVDPRRPRLELAVTDRQGIPIEQAIVEVEAIPLLQVDRGGDLGLAATTPGRYEADLPASVAGQWEFRVRVRHGDETYTDRFRRVLELGRPAGKERSG